MNAWPSLHTVLYDGWVLRFAKGVTRRANSINPIYESTISIENKIRHCEDVYLNSNLPVIYKLTSTVFPPNLDMLLDKEGYLKDAETSVQVKTIKGEIFKSNKSIKISEQFKADWLLRFIEFNSYDINKKDGFESILKHIIQKKCFLDVVADNKYIGCGLGVLEDKFIGLFDIVVKPEFRKQGYGKLIVESLLDWGKTNGAETAYLQVMLNSPNAINLYKKIGFNEVYKYWYRVKQK